MGKKKHSLPIIISLLLVKALLSFGGSSSPFTITKIEVSTEEERATVKLYFTDVFEERTFRENFTILPLVRIHWWRSGLRQEEEEYVFYLRGAFQPGQKYTILFKDTFESTSKKKFKPGVNTFTIPDITPTIEFASPQRVIERNSRQMLHLKTVNIRELLVEGVNIPPLFVPWVNIEETQPISELKSWLIAKQTSLQPVIEDLKKKLKEKLQILPPEKIPQKFYFHLKALKKASEQKIIHDKEVFFVSKRKNTWQAFSLPLNFRKEKTKGRIFFISLKDNQAPDKPLSQKLLRVTDLGISYKISPSSLLIWITSLYSGKPLRKVSLLAYTKKKEIFLLGETNSKGVLLVKDKAVLGKVTLGNFEKPFFEEASLNLEELTLILAAQRDDCSYIKVGPPGGYLRVTGINQTRSPSEKERLLKAALFTERGIYRPGERVYFKATLREYSQGEILVPSDIEPLLRIEDAKGEEIFSKNFKLSEFGTFGGEVELKKYYPLGTYTIFLCVGEETLTRWTFQVQEFRAPRHFVEVTFEKKRRVSKEYVNLEIEEHYLLTKVFGKYYAGGPVKHARVRWKVYYTPTEFKKKNYPNYTFGCPHHKRRLLETGESISDEQGELRVEVPLSREVINGVWGLEFVVSVIDFDGRVATTRERYQETPPYLVGIKKDGDEIEAGREQLLRAIVLTPQGKKMLKGNLEVKVMEESYGYIRKRNAAGHFYWQEQRVWRELFSTRVPISQGRAKFKFKFPWGGKYSVSFTYRKTEKEVYTSSVLCKVSGYDYYTRYREPEERWQKIWISADKKCYSQDEKIHLSLSSEVPVSSCLLTIERESILDYQLVEFKDKRSKIKLDITSKFYPNIYIGALATVARGEFPVFKEQYDIEAPHFLTGYINLEIVAQRKKLLISINKEELELKKEPGEEVSLSFLVLDDQGKKVLSELAVGVVDESVLALTGFKTPTLGNLLKFIQPLSVFTAELRKELLKQTPFEVLRNQPLTGGGGIKRETELKTRKDFRPVAYFNPRVVTDKEGRAKVSFSLPDTMTTYRIYVIGCDQKSKFGHAERKLKVVKDFYLEPGLPRFFTRGDKFKFYVSAFNKTSLSGSLEFSFKVSPQFDLKVKEKKYSLKAYDRVLIPLEGLLRGVGKGKLKFRAKFNNQLDSIELSLPLSSGLIMDRDIVFGKFEGKGELTYSFPPGTEKINWSMLNPEEVSCWLTISSAPLSKLAPAFKYLLQYPYGCVEQTSSGVLPLAGLRGLIADGFLPDIPLEEVDKFLSKGVERLLSMQTSSGGFAYWPGHIKPDRWGTVYALAALTSAKLAGLKLPEKKIAQGLDYLVREIRNEIRNKERRENFFRAFSSYILSLNGWLPKDIWKSLKKTKKLSPEDSFLITLSGGISKFLPREAVAKKLLKLISKPLSQEFYHPFRARYLREAVFLLGAVEFFPDHKLTHKFAYQLLEEMGRRARWSSTSDTGWCLIALGKYFEKSIFIKEEERIKCIVSQNSQKWKFEIPRGKSYTLELNPKEFLRKPFVQLSSNTHQSLFYTLNLRFPRVDYNENGYSNGFEISKKIIPLAGGKEIHVGDVVKVKLKIKPTAIASSYRYLVLDDPLPAGLVAINTAIKTEETPQHDDLAWDAEEGWYRFVPNFFEIRDTRVLVFKNYLWRGTVYHYSYYARAVCEGEFIIPPTKIELMYQPEICGYTPASKIIIKERRE
jgi:hypothetical protein